jgi:predicted nucleic acid-binding protein
VNVLADTSVWSLALRRKSGQLNAHESAVVSELAELVREERVRLIGIVRQEVLSGIKEPAQFDRLRSILRAYEDEPLTTDDFEAAAKASNECRARGVLSSAVDILICATAIRRKWLIFTTDPDFRRYASIISIRLHQSRNLRP